MKTKLLIMILPVLVVFIGSCTGLVEDLIDKEIDEIKILGNWKATEYYTNDANVDGKDFSNINLIKNKAVYEHYMAPCTTKLSKDEFKINAMTLKFSEGNTGKQYIDFFQQETRHDESCKSSVDDNGSVYSLDTKWKFSNNGKKLLIDNVIDQYDDFEYEVVTLTESKLELLVDDGESYLKIVFVRDL